jgi:dipeptide/tripeptide permease
MAFAVGSIFAPVIGGALKDAYNFETSCDIMGVFATCFSIIYALIARVITRDELEVKM